VLAEKREGNGGEETSRLQKALADQAKKGKPGAPAAENPAARFYRLMNEAQTIEELDRVLADAQATLKGADLNSAENYAKDRLAALAGRSE
jgi:hypothetical protein